MRLLNYCTKTDHSLPRAPCANLEEMHPDGCAQKNSTCPAEDLDHYKGPTLMISLCSLHILDTTAADPSRIFSKCFTTKELGCCGVLHTEKVPISLVRIHQEPL